MTESIVLLSPPAAWSGNAGPACSGRAPLWDYDAGEDANGYAKAICRTCPVRERCLGVGIRDELSGVWGGVALLNGKPHVVLRLANTSTHRHRANGEPLCNVCIDAEAVRLCRRRGQDAARRRAKKAGVA